MGACLEMGGGGGVAILYWGFSGVFPLLTNMYYQIIA